MNTVAHPRRASRAATERQQMEVQQRQLLIYAQDLRELMDQHRALQRRYQTVLEAQGRGDHNPDLLCAALQTGPAWCLVTDRHGQIRHASPNAQLAVSTSALPLHGLSISQLAAPEHGRDISNLLDCFSGLGPTGAIQQRRLTLGQGNAAQTYHALVVPWRQLDRCELLWCLKPVSADPADTGPGPFDPAPWLQQSDCPQALVLTDAQTTLLAGNAAFTRVTGYDCAELQDQPLSLLGDPTHDPDFERGFWTQLLDSGCWSGELHYVRRNGQHYTVWANFKAVQDERGRTQAYLGAFSDLTRSASNAQHLAALAYQDELTGLPNRRQLEQRLTQALGAAQNQDLPLYLMCIDINHFKQINQDWGHAAGDHVLREVSRRLAGRLQTGELLARLGSDQWVLMLTEARTDEDAYGRACALLKTLSAPLAVAGRSLELSATVGCARYPQDADGMEDLLTQADSAMLAAKLFGLEFNFFDTGVSQTSKADIALDLWQAPQRGEMHLLFQPQWSTEQPARLRGCEALLRWQHPVLGPIPTNTFIPIAEKTGAIVGLGDWVLSTACTQLRQLRDHGLPELKMCINLSALELTDPQLPARVSHALERSGLPADALELEFTEAAAMQYLGEDAAPLHALRGLGVRLALDVYGLGFYSLSLLRTLPLNRLTINHRFVRDLTRHGDARAISQCLVQMGQSLGLEVIAGGVEDAQQARILTELGCHAIQGFYSGRPMNAEQLPAPADLLGAGAALSLNP